MPRSLTTAHLATGSIDDPEDDGPCTFQFIGSRPDLEQAAFIQDLYPCGKLDDQCGRALGPLPTAAEQAGG